MPHHQFWLHLSLQFCPYVAIIASLYCMGIDFFFPAGIGVFKALDLNSDKELTYKNGKAVKAAFQVSHIPRNNEWMGT